VRARQREPVRTMERVEVVETERGLRIEVQSSGFLYKQVRNMVGLLIDVGSGKRDARMVSTILESRDREAHLYQGAAAQGLYLASVEYPPEQVAPIQLSHYGAPFRAGVAR
jgi:tRNA pseudouridine38-40 synthase